MYIIYIVNFVLGGRWWLIIKLSFVTCHTKQISLRGLTCKKLFYNCADDKKGRREG